MEVWRESKLGDALYANELGELKKKKNVQHLAPFVQKAQLVRLRGELEFLLFLLEALQGWYPN